MSDNIGIFMEEEMAILFNGKKFNELSSNSRTIIRTMFGHVDDNEVIKCERVEGYMKPDLKFTVKDTSHYVSMKSGSNGIVHQELVLQLCDHLKEIGISKQTIDTILLFHFGDGTTDGTGKTRRSYRDVSYILKKRIAKANIELNSNRRFVLHMVNRLLFKGTKSENIVAEFIYHGDTEYGVIVTRKQVLKHVEMAKYEFLENLHIGPLIMHPHARYVGKKVSSEKKRNTIEFHWPNYFTSLRKIAARYNTGIY